MSIYFLTVILSPSIKSILKSPVTIVNPFHLSETCAIISSKWSHHSFFSWVDEKCRQGTSCFCLGQKPQGSSVLLICGDLSRLHVLCR